MQRTQRIATGLVVWALTAAAAAQQPIIYPARGQSAQKQNTRHRRMPVVGDAVDRD